MALRLSGKQLLHPRYFLTPFSQQKKAKPHLEVDQQTYRLLRTPTAHLISGTRSKDTDDSHNAYDCPTGHQALDCPNHKTNCIIRPALWGWGPFGP